MTDSLNPVEVSVAVAVLTVSDTRTRETDTSGNAIAALLKQAGHQVVAQEIVPDDFERIQRSVAGWIERPEISVVITTGGTGITRRDVTPDAIEPLITKRIDGFGELFRAMSYEDVGVSTIQSRALGAVCGKTLVFALPGSTGAVRSAMEKILLPQLDTRTRPCNFVMLFDRL